MPLAQRGRRLPRPPCPTAGFCLLRKSVARTAEWSRRAPRGSLGLHLSRGFLPMPTTRGFPQISSHELPTGLTSRPGSSESRSSPGRFVSVETTAPPEVLAPRSVSRRFETARPGLMVSPRTTGDIAAPRRPMRAVPSVPPKVRRDRMSVSHLASHDLPFVFIARKSALQAKERRARRFSCGLSTARQAAILRGVWITAAVENRCFVCG